MSADLASYFDKFVKEISLDKSRLKRMSRAAATLRELLVEEYGLPPADEFLQGSYPNNTVIEPVEGGEYDIDMVAICVNQNVTGDVALNDLESRLTADGRYKDRIVRKAPCVRLEYSEDEVGKFHVDVVPLRRIPETGELKAPRRGAQWKTTAPSEYTEWCRAQGEQFTCTVKIMKRWRDQQQEVHDAIKSIVLQVLVAGAMPDVKDDAARVAATFRALHARLSSLSRPPEVSNPVLPFEDLAANWPVADFFSFVKELGEAVDAMTEVDTTTTLAEAASIWSEVLGPDFPLPSPEELGLRLESTSHAKQLNSDGWTLALDTRYHVKVAAKRTKHNRAVSMVPFKSGSPTPIGCDLRFIAEVTSPGPVTVFWQVVNTGDEAAADDDLRGDFIESRDRMGNPRRGSTETWETAKYRGCHQLRAVLVVGSQVVAVSDYFKVPIFRGSRATNRPGQP